MTNCQSMTFCTSETALDDFTRMQMTILIADRIACLAGHCPQQPGGGIVWLSGITSWNILGHYVGLGGLFGG